MLLLKDLLEILINFELIVSYFGDSIIEIVSNTNFMVYLTNAYCLLRKVGKIWIKDNFSKYSKHNVDACVENGLKLTIQICAEVMQQGIIQRINVHSKNYPMVQNKMAQTIKSFIMTITGNLELSKDVLHKSLNFITNDEEARNQNIGDATEPSIYSGKNYSINFIRQLFKRGVNLK